MADVLKVTPEKLQETAGQFKSHQSNLQTAYLTMSDAVRSLDTTWNGEASEQFKAQFDSMYKNLSQTEAKMKDAIDELLKANEIFSTTETEIGNTVGSLDQGTDPFS